MKGYAIYSTKIGDLKIAYDGEKIIGVYKIDKAHSTQSQTDASQKIQQQTGAAHSASQQDVSAVNKKTALTQTVFSQLSEYLDGKRKDFDFPYEMRGTEFQKKVWKALCSIPYGETRSYKAIAEMIGNSKGYRAVGMANNRNPLLIVVPCHRVIGANGDLVGYGGGLDVKKLLLDLEAGKS